MASSIKTISALLSPRFRSQLTPKKNLLGKPKSDGKVHYQQLTRPHVVKKLDFSENKKHVLKFTRDALRNPIILPHIKIENVPDKVASNDLDNFEELHFRLKGDKSLEINTPNKLDLVKNGLENLRNHTKILGKGAFGTVFRGKHKGQTVAVKIVNRKNCLREENALYLSHNNIVRTFEIVRNSEHQNYCLIMMEYLSNCRNLQEALDHFPVGLSSLNTEKLLKKFCLDITTGLDYCHSNGVLHLDLKPKNILVNSENVCKICDFGNSAKAEENLGSFKHYGTVMYTAPEILMGKVPSAKSDIYSLGLIFWQVKYRRNPFQSYDSVESIIYNVGKYNVRPTYEDKSPDILTKIFTKCWQSNPDIRPNTAQILKDLVEFM